jgi:SAM-dependent methyltransferase
MQLPHASAEFDAVYGVQVLEYMPDVGKALQEILRVLRPKGRLVNLATNWSSAVWHSRHPERMKRVLAEWAAHAPYLDLPAILAAELRKAGLQPLRQRPVPVLNMSYNENTFSYWVARMIARFVAGRGAVTREEADAWLAEFNLLETDAEYFFSSTPVLTEGNKDLRRSRLYEEETRFGHARDACGSPNSTFDRPASSHSLAAAGQRERSPHLPGQSTVVADA